MLGRIKAQDRTTAVADAPHRYTWNAFEHGLPG